MRHEARGASPEAGGGDRRTAATGLIDFDDGALGDEGRTDGRGSNVAFMFEIFTEKVNGSVKPKLPVPR